MSDDNAFSEAQFKTLKYQPDYPGSFASLLHAKAWCEEFFNWFNYKHQHSGIALFAPADVFYLRVDEIVARRQDALDRAHSAHPERFPNGPPVARRPPTVVSINPVPVLDDTAPKLTIQQDEVIAPSPERARAMMPFRDTRAAGAVALHS